MAPPRDPTADIEPDFESDDWRITRDALVNGGGSEAEATDTLRQAWRTQHQRNLDTWNDYLRQQSPNGNQDGDNPNGHGTPPIINPPSDKEDPVWLNRPTPAFLDIKPARHVLKRLEKKEFVELWHFTAQGCRDAAVIDLTAPDDTFGLVNTEKGLMLQTVGASTVSSKVIKDENLSWEMLTEGKRRLINCMKTCGWSEHEMRELAKFFVNLDLHPIRSQEYGTQAILRYQERVRRDWTGSLRGDSTYAIGIINDDLMTTFQREIAMEIQARTNVSQVLTNYNKRNNTNFELEPPEPASLQIPLHHRTRSYLHHRTCSFAPSHPLLQITAPAPCEIRLLRNIAPAPRVLLPQSR